MNDQPEPHQQILDYYRRLIGARHPAHIGTWPILSGYNVKTGLYNGWLVVVFEHTANSAMTSFSGLGQISNAIIGASEITEANKEIVRARIEKHFRVGDQDGVILVSPTRMVDDELNKLMIRHEFAMGLIPQKIFLSHKGVDKPLIREYCRTLELLGFEPWLDEDAMVAGVELERGLLQGFRDSCAAIFFVTPNFQDANYLATEVNYAIAEKRAKGNRFSIITLAFADESGKKGSVPDLLRTYIYKEPQNDLEALREIIRALPIVVGNVYWRA